MVRIVYGTKVHNSILSFKVYKHGHTATVLKVKKELPRQALLLALLPSAPSSTAGSRVPNWSGQPSSPLTSPPLLSAFPSPFPSFPLEVTPPLKNS